MTLATQTEKSNASKKRCELGSGFLGTLISCSFTYLEPSEEGEREREREKTYAQSLSSVFFFHPQVETMNIYLYLY